MLVTFILMSKILIQFAHPAFSRSRVHKSLVKQVRDLKGVTFNDLYENYPDLFIDVRREKELLLEHDIIILQHPFYWYSGPPIIKQWLDLVLEYNWAYGPEGRALVGKKMFNAISCGSGEHAYSNAGHHSYPVSQFLLPFKQTAILCNMDYLPPFIVYGSHHLDVASLDENAHNYGVIIRKLVNDELPAGRYKNIDYLNELTVTQPSDK